MRKLVVNDGTREREVLLVGNIVVGRDPACDLSDADPLLSRRHAEFVVNGSQVSVRDLGSRNGILVNDAKVTERRLSHGDAVQIGHMLIRFVDEQPAEAAPAPAGPPAAADGHPADESDGDGATIILPRPSSAAPIQPVEPPVPVAAVASPAAVIPPQSAPPQVNLPGVAPEGPSSVSAARTGAPLPPIAIHIGALAATILILVFGGAIGFALETVVALTAAYAVGAMVSRLTAPKVAPDATVATDTTTNTGSRGTTDRP